MLGFLAFSPFNQGSSLEMLYFKGTPAKSRAVVYEKLQGAQRFLIMKSWMPSTNSLYRKTKFFRSSKGKS